MFDEVLLYGNEILSEPCVDLTIDPEKIPQWKPFIEQMIEIMEEKGGIGLAANQIGMQVAAFVWRFDGKTGVAINPKIEADEEGGTAITFPEGCLSVPGVRVPMNRITKVVLTAYDEDGELRTIKASGLEATIFQHEMDHLNGFCIADHLNRENRRAIKRALQKR